MSESTPAATTAPLSLVSRALGVITSPKATFENVVAAPRPVGILLVVAAILPIGSSVPGFTESASKPSLDMQVKTIERFGQTVTPEMYERMENQSRNVAIKAVGVVSAFVVL